MVDSFAWLFPRGAGKRQLEQVLARCQPERLQEALRTAYWAARRSLVTGVEARHRRGLERRVASLARLEDAITAVLDLEEPVPAELAGHLHVARAHLRLAVREIRFVEVAPRGRPRGWHVEAEGVLRGLGLKRSEARSLLAHVERLVQEHPVRLREAPPLRVAFRAPEPTRAAIIRHLPMPAANKESGETLLRRRSALSSSA